MDPVRRSFDSEVSESGPGVYRAVARMVDPFHEIELTLTVRLADLHILDAQAGMPRVPYPERCPDSLRRVADLKGIGIGPGFNRKVREIVGDDCGCPYLVDLAAQAGKLIIVAAESQRAREAVLVHHDRAAFTAIRRRMGSCAGHLGLPDEVLPAWLEREQLERGSAGAGEPHGGGPPHEATAEDTMRSQAGLVSTDQASVREWLTHLFAVVDSMDAARFAEYFVADGRFVYGSGAPVSGKQAIGGHVAGFFDSLESIRHTILGATATSNQVMGEVEVTYVFRNGIQATLPAFVLLKMEGELIRDYLIYIDPSPVSGGG